jgi:rhamnulose-1-phosphate aldolase/alcohol dehydrogenase
MDAASGYDALAGTLIARSNRLGADRRVTNFAGGNTSAKVVLPDPITGEDVEVLAVKGTGGDLGTLTVSGLAFLRLDRVRALERLYDGGEREDDIVKRYADCAFGMIGAVPSIDTPLHAFVAQADVDHLHPDAVIALATAADGLELTRRCYGDEVAWIDWKRPGFELGLQLRDLQRRLPDVKGAVMGGHGMICWAPTSEECEALSLRLIARAEAFIERSGKPDPFGPHVEAFEPLDAAERRAEAMKLAPIVRGLASRDTPMIGCFTDAPVVLEFLESEAAPRLAALGTSCPDHFLRTKVRPLLLDLGPQEPFDRRVDRLRQLHESYRRDYAAYYERYATESSPPMRGADPAIVLLPGVGMFSFGPDPLNARVAGEFYVNAINVMRGAEAVSSYEPISEAEKFGIEYWELEERKLRLRPAARPLQGRVAVVTGGGSGIGRAITERLAEEGACVAILDLDDEAAGKVAASIGGDRALSLRANVADESEVERAFDETALAFGGIDIVVNNAGFAASATLGDTTAEQWDRLHAVLARGAFLVSRAAGRRLIDQGTGGDIVYVVSKNSVAAGPRNIAYGAAKADQAHQVRLLAVELGPHGIRVNGVNPDAVVRGSGIFTGEWLQERAEAHGVAPDDLGEFYAARTLLGEEVLPEHVASAVFALVSGAFPRTTGMFVPVDGGLPEAFLR